MPVRIVQSKQNARLKELRRALAPRREKMLGVAGIEGPHLVEEAVRAGLRLITVFAGETMQHKVQHMRFPDETEVLIVPAGILASVLGTETPQPLAALIEVPDWTWAHVLRSRGAWPPLVLVLAGLQDPGNLGTIVRSAEAFGATGIVALPGTVSVWNPKAVRASAGSVFRVPVITAGVDECFTSLREAGVRVLTTAPRGVEAAHQSTLAAAVALVIGNEGSGVPQELAARADEHIAIPCPGPVESLNAAVAASVLLYEVSRQRAQENSARTGRRGSTR
ncbi:MAG TPA: RNA methyltransferase [Terracidiphilus sp.]|nr:RNA methyltransferase [Terracidiphilus sp.]